MGKLENYVFEYSLVYTLYFTIRIKSCPILAYRKSMTTGGKGKGAPGIQGQQELARALGRGAEMADVT